MALTVVASLKDYLGVENFGGISGGGSPRQIKKDLANVTRSYIECRNLFTSVDTFLA
jgi:hypothetical protein